MRVLGASVLALEAIVVLLAIPVVVFAGTGWVTVPTPVAVVGGIVLAGALLWLASKVTRPWAITMGWVLQGLVVVSGLLAPTMFVIGGIFALLWLLAIRLARQVEDSQARAAQGEDGEAGTTAGPEAGG